MKLKIPQLPYKFPHFTRIISARIPLKSTYFALWSLILLVLLLNLTYALLKPLTFEMKLRMAVVKKPFTSFPHQELANYYLKENLAEAKIEFYLAEEYYQDNLLKTNADNLLGTQSTPLTTWRNLTTYREKLATEAKTWEEVLQTYPNYHFALLKLASLYYQLDDYDKTQRILKTLLQQNPANREALELNIKIN